MRSIISGIFTAFALLFPFKLLAQSSVLVLEGNYQGKNLIVQNPFTASGVGFCVYEVTVNDEVSTDEWASSAFEVDFNLFQLNIGDVAVVKIKHKNDCHPKVLNPEVLKPKSTFDVTSMSVSEKGVLKWCTEKETGKLDFIIEQYRWNKWIKIGEIAGKGTPDEHCYSHKVIPHSGENRLRLKQVDHTGTPRYSNTKTFNDPSIPEITFNPKKVSKDITFSNETLYEIYDQYGNIVKRGFASKVPCTNLKKGIYYFNFDNKIDNFIKK